MEVAIRCCGHLNSDSEDPTLADAPQEFEVSFAELGIKAVDRTLGTDAFSAEILTANQIASFEGVASGSILSATWPLAEVGEHGWYVRTSDPYGAVDISPVQLFNVLPATDPGPGNGDGGDDGDGDGSGPGDGSGGGGTPGQPGAGGGSGSGGSDADAGDGALATTGGDVSGLIGWVITVLASGELGHVG